MAHRRIDAGPRINDDDIALAQNAANETRVVLLRQQESVHQRFAKVGRWLEEIENAGSVQRQALFQRLEDSFGTAAPGSLRACIVQIDPLCEATGSSSAMNGFQILSDYLDSLMEHVDMRGCVGVIRGGAVLALVSDDRPDVAARLSTVARQVAVHHGVAARAVGLGGVLGNADGLPMSIKQAEFAARVAARVAGLKGQACWDTLGEYRFFFSYEWGPSGVAAIDPGVAALLEQGRAVFAETVLAYLERQGDVNATAAALNVHRTTLYYRLGQATQILGEDLSGHARFRIHAALLFAQPSCQ